MKVTGFRLIFWPIFTAFTVFALEAEKAEHFGVPMLAGAAVGSTLFILLSLIYKQAISRLMTFAIVVATFSFFVFLISLE
jgi:hypothetical protein